MRLPIALLALSLVALPAGAEDLSRPAAAYLDEHLRSWATDPQIVAATVAQNAVTGGYSQADIDRLDLQWRAEVGTSGSELVGGVLANPAADMLRDRVAASEGMILEVFVMDAKGLNVAAVEATSDYWQGDEAKFSETFPLGPEAVHVSDVDYDESMQVFMVQVSFPIIDSLSGSVVGAITVGLDAARL